MDPARILVVDDQPVNVRLLERKLQRAGFAVLTAFNGPDALKLAQDELPDVVLLDIMMPVMDGLEVCRQMKAQPATRDIPVIFITAKTAKEVKIEGLETGAADYITKPVDLDETLARVDTQLRIRRQHAENLELGRRLAETRRHAAVAHVTEGIAHNLNNLLGVVVGYVDLLKTSLDHPDRLRRSTDKLDVAVQRMVEIVRELTTVAEFDQVRKKAQPLAPILEQAVRRFQHENDLPEAHISVDDQCPGLELETNQELLEDILSRLMLNAWESYRNQAANLPHEITLLARQVSHNGEPHLRVEIADRGEGVPTTLRENIFEPFVTNHAAIGRGMGLTIVRHSIHTLGGSAQLEDRPEGGTLAIILHPLSEPEPAILPDGIHELESPLDDVT